MITYPTYDEIEEAVGPLRDDDIFGDIMDHMWPYRGALPTYNPGPEDNDGRSVRPMLREDGGMVQSVSEIADLVAGEIGDLIRQWQTCLPIEDLRDLLLRLEAWGELQENPDCDNIDITDLPVAEEYLARFERCDGWPVWACDDRGYCLTGADAHDVEHISEIEAALNGGD